MITHLVRKNNKLYCHNCKMEQKTLKEECNFCGYFFSNYEVLLLELNKESKENFKINN